jgi:hypothetical protein
MKDGGGLGILVTDGAPIEFLIIDEFDLQIDPWI